MEEQELTKGAGIETGLLLNFGAERLEFKRKTRTYLPKRFYPVNPVNPVQCFHGGLGRKLGQDEQDGQDAEMEEQELTKGIGAGVNKAGLKVESQKAKPIALASQRNRCQKVLSCKSCKSCPMFSWRSRQEIETGWTGCRDGGSNGVSFA